MKSDICLIKKGGIGLEKTLIEVEKVTTYNSLDKKQALRLRLLAEELNGMLPELVENFDGIFWVENNENKYELHVELNVDSLSKEKKKALIAVSSDKKNAKAVGFMGKIREIAENMLLFSEESDGMFMPFQYLDEYHVDSYYSCYWSLNQYTIDNSSDSKKKKEWDELEKSIVAKLADDVIVGVRGKKVEIIIKKAF